tara:strand:+ start:437 stop:667 length:231 start_codon:yes stop_codon:yes gene_type:complete
MDIIDVLRTKIQSDMNRATWEVNRLLADPLQDEALSQLDNWTEIYATAHAKMDMLNRLKAQKDSDAYEEQNNTTNS